MEFILSQEEQEQELREYFYENSKKVFRIDIKKEEINLSINNILENLLTLDISLFIPAGLFELYILDNFGNLYLISKDIFKSSKKLILGDLAHTIKFKLDLFQTVNSSLNIEIYDTISKIKYFEIILEKRS